MKRLTENKIILIVRKTRLEELIARFNTIGQARFYVEHLGADFSDYELEDKKYKDAMHKADRQLRNLGIVQVLDRAFLPNFVFGKDDLIVVLGQDGLVANTLKYLNGQPVIAVNPDSSRWDGLLLPFEVNDLTLIVQEVFQKLRKHRQITMAQVLLNNGQRIYGVNDIYIGPKTHISIRYEIHIGGKRENHSSSGIIVSTGLGSTGWLKSILAGARGIGCAFGKNVGLEEIKNFTWESKYLYFTVREPFPSKITDAKIVFGKITERENMRLISQMPENGVIFSDGIENDFLEFNSGTEAVITVADNKGCLVI